ncbi:MAG: hypothetical protein R3C11_04370 [Planctomycetaceae bacterium]
MSSVSTPVLNESGSTSATRPFYKRKPILIGGVLLLIIASALIWDEFFKYQFFAKRFGEVVPGEIFRSGQISVAMFEPTVRKHDIQVVIDLNGFDTTDSRQVNEVETSKRLGIEHYRYRLDGDGRGDITEYANAIEKLVECQETGKPVLVHAAGAHRTGGVVACYRMLLEDLPAEKAYKEMCSTDYGEVSKVACQFISTNISRISQKNSFNVASSKRCLRNFHR